MSETSAERTILIGTRGSLLALRQTEVVLEALRRHHPARPFDLKTITTMGDRAREAPLKSLAGEGLFTKELESALLEKQVDLAVHSLKDLPTAETPGLSLVAFPERAEVRDVLICPGGYTLEELPSGSRVGTSSPRRAVQLQALRPDLKIHPIRGNVDTRLRKAEEGQYDAVVLAAAGLERLGLQERITQYLTAELCLPAVGQGILAIQSRDDDHEVVALLRVLDHRPSRLAALAERAFLAALGGGCRIPIAALCRMKGKALEMDGLVAKEDGSKVLRSRLSGDPSQPEALGQALAREMLEKGAGGLLGLGP